MPALRFNLDCENPSTMGKLKVRVVCCDDTPERRSRMVEAEVDSEPLDERVLETIEQELAAGEAKDLHNAAHHPEEGPVTYFQQIHEGRLRCFCGGIRRSFRKPSSVRDLTWPSSTTRDRVTHPRLAPRV